MSWWTQNIICIASKKVLHYLFECIPLFWFITEHQKMCSAINLNVFYSDVIICRASKKVLNHLSEFIIPNRDSMQTIQKGVASSIWIYYPLLWFYAKNKWRCCTVYLNKLSSALNLFRTSNNVLHYFKYALAMTYNPFTNSFRNQDMVFKISKNDD